MNRNYLPFLILVLLVLPMTCGAQSRQAFTTQLTGKDSGVTVRGHYSTNVDFSKWKITDNKAVDIELEVINLPNGTQLRVEHMHADIVIESHISYFDGITQDSMDDYVHGSDNPGFLISLDYPYFETFSIEGSSPSFQQSVQTSYDWGYAARSKGDTKEFKFSESQLTGEYQVYGETIFIVYDILIMHANETWWHKQIVSHNLFVNLDGEIVDNSGDARDASASSSAPLWGAGILLAVMLIPTIRLYRRFKFEHSG